MSSELDWSDPKKLMRRDGGEVLACWTEENGCSHGPPQYWAVTVTPEGQREINMYTPRGHYGLCPIGRDIIPRPREPRTVERWIDPLAFSPSDRMFRHYKKPYSNLVRVKIIEVIE